MGRKVKDLVGQKFGRLTVLAMSPDRDSVGQIQWLCRCDCGNIVEVSGRNLMYGSTSSCGCLRSEGKIKELKTRNMPKLDLRGIRFGRLTAISPTYRRDATGSVVWKCKCDCGKTVYVGASNLRSGNTKSCGCLNIKRTKSRRGRKVANLKGKRFGRLTVVASTFLREPANKSAIWKCKCDCGKITYVNSDALKSGRTKSCGCLRVENCAKVGKARWKISA